MQGRAACDTFVNSCNRPPRKCDTFSNLKSCRAISLHTFVKVQPRGWFRCIHSSKLVLGGHFVAYTRQIWSPRTIALHILIKIPAQRPFHNIHASKFRLESHFDGCILQNYCPRTILLHRFRKVAEGGPLSGVRAGVLSQRSWFCRFQECYPRDFEAMGMATCRSSTLL